MAHPPPLIFPYHGNRHRPEGAVIEIRQVGMYQKKIAKRVVHYFPEYDGTLIISHTGYMNNYREHMKSARDIFSIIYMRALEP